MLTHDQLKRAEEGLLHLEYADMSEGEQAWYDLLSFQTAWKLNRPVNSTKVLDKCINYFEKHRDKSHLAQAYYYKGSLMCEKGDVKPGIIFYKKAERIVGSNDLITRHHIYEGLSNYNLKYNSMGLALQYATDALRCAKALDKPDWEGYDHYLLVLCYHDIGKEKEADLHTQQILKLLPRMTDKGQMDVLGVLGEYYQQRNPKLMEQLMVKALQQKEYVTPYLYMAAWRYNQGNKGEAYALISKAEKMKRGKNNYALLEVKRDMKMQDGDFKTANTLSMQMIALKDSLWQVENRKNLQASQQSFDQRIEAGRRLRMSGYLVMAVVTLILGIAVLIFYQKFRMQKMKGILDSDRLEIAQLNERIAKERQIQVHTERQRVQQEGEVTKLTNTIAQIEKRHNGLLAEGRQCYISIMNGQSTVDWKKRNFQAFVEYYKLVDASFLHDMEQKYDGLTDRNKTILILEHLGLSYEQIGTILGVSAGAVRTANYRIEQRLNRPIV